MPGELKMDVSIQIAIISASASVFVAAVTVILTQRNRREDELRKRKQVHYESLFAAISDLAVHGKDNDGACKDFARASNTITLVSPYDVIDALMNFNGVLTGVELSKDKHDELLKVLVLVIRKDMGFRYRNSPEEFNFHLIGSNPR
jgi:hypothetical protein